MRPNPTRVVAAAVLVAVAACSDRATNPVAPSDRPASLSRDIGQDEALTHAIVHPTVERMARIRAQHAAGTAASTGGNLIYGGGAGDGSLGNIGVETAPKVYLVFWGAQWVKSVNGTLTIQDPSNEANIVYNFLRGAGGSSWLNSVTQYCQGVAQGTVYCGSAGAHAGNPSGILVAYWFDYGTAAPSVPTQSQLGAEAVRAAGHFGNTTASSNVTAQYVVATASGNSSSGFGSQYCAYHSWTSSSYGNVAYTNLPYITDAGASCGANANNLGATAGITIVEGHELAETISDQFPGGGWLDSSGAENGDKCAWTGLTSVSFSTGAFPVQPLWSNAANGGAGGCALSY